jgi:hypothetical protein
MHTFLLKPGVWRAEGWYTDAAGQSLPVDGETRISHSTETWIIDGWMRLPGDPPLELRNRYEVVPLPAGGDHTSWSSLNPALGALNGSFVLAGDSILSTYRSTDGQYVGIEYLLQINERMYQNRGALLAGAQRISTWLITLKRIEKSESRRPAAGRGGAR